MRLLGSDGEGGSQDIFMVLAVLSKMLPAVNNTSPLADWDRFTAGVGSSVQLRVQGLCPLTLALNLVVYVLGALWREQNPCQWKSLCFQKWDRKASATSLNIKSQDSSSSLLEYEFKKRVLKSVLLHGVKGAEFGFMNKPPATPFGLTQGSAQVNIQLLEVRMLFWKIPFKLGGTTLCFFCFCCFSSFLWEVSWRQNMGKIPNLSKLLPEDISPQECRGNCSFQNAFVQTKLTWVFMELSHKENLCWFHSGGESRFSWWWDQAPPALVHSLLVQYCNWAGLQSGQWFS